MYLNFSIPKHLVNRHYTHSTGPMFINVLCSYIHLKYTCIIYKKKKSAKCIEMNSEEHYLPFYASISANRKLFLRNILKNPNFYKVK